MSSVSLTLGLYDSRDLVVQALLAYLLSATALPSGGSQAVAHKQWLTTIHHHASAGRCHPSYGPATWRELCVSAWVDNV